MNAIILPYKNGSRSGAALANALGVRQIRLAGSTIHRQRPKKIINWGNSGRNLPPRGIGVQHEILNTYDAVSDAANKLRTFNVLGSSSTRIPEYTTEVEIAQTWFEDTGTKVVERHQLTGHSGAGIRIVDNLDNLQGAPLYVKYVKKQDEYRVHIMAGEVIDVQRKGRRSDVPDEDVNWQVRNHQNGFCYMREGVNPDADVIQQAFNAIGALGLDFGAVDVIWNNRQQKAYVLEVNTACGLEGTTLERYKVAFQELLSSGEVTPLEGYDFSEETSDLEGFSEDVASDETYALTPEDTPATQQPLTLGILRVGMRLRALRENFAGTALQVGDVVDVLEKRGNVFLTSTPYRRGHYIFAERYLNTGYFELVDDVVVQEEQDTALEEVGYSDQHRPQYHPDFPLGCTVEVVNSGRVYPNIPWARTRDTQINDGETGVVVGSTRNDFDNSIMLAVKDGRGEVFVINTGGVSRTDNSVVPPAPAQEHTAAPEQPRLNKWLVSVDGSVNLEEGVFDTQEEAEMALVSPDFHNMRQLGHDVRVVSL